MLCKNIVRLGAALDTFFKHLYVGNSGTKGDWEFRIFDLVKETLMELIFNPCGEFR